MALTLCAIAPANAAVLTSATILLGGGSSSAVNGGPPSAFLELNVLEIFSAPLPTGDVSLDITGAAFDALVAAFTDGVLSASVTAGVRDSNGGGSGTAIESIFSGLGPSDLQGLTIAAIRLTIDNVCIKSDPDGAECGFTSPGRTGYSFGPVRLTFYDTIPDEIPVPGAIILFASGLAALGAIRRRRFA